MSSVSERSIREESEKWNISVQRFYILLIKQVNMVSVQFFGADCEEKSVKIFTENFTSIDFVSSVSQPF